MKKKARGKKAVSITQLLRSSGYAETRSGVWTAPKKKASKKKRSKKKVSKRKTAKKPASKKTTTRKRVGGSFEQWLKEQGYTKGRSGWLSPDGKKFFPL